MDARSSPLRKLLLALSAFAVLLVISTEALARSPIVYNAAGYQVGVIRQTRPNGSVIVLPSSKTLGLGYYHIAIAPENLRPRARGGWETDLTNDEIPYIPPVSPRRFWQPSGF
jgi:hypothetical protein